MQEGRTWRDLLAEIIRDPREKQRIAAALDVNPVTPSRWANGLSRPHAQHHKKLIEAIPARHRQEFAELFAVDYPTSREPIINEPGEEPVNEIPSTFYARIFSAYTSTPHELRITSILSLILQQMLSHLDIDQEGISISVALCTAPPEGEVVRSLHEFAGRGTAPFDSHLEMQPFFLGIGTMAGDVVTHGRQLVIQNLREEKGFALSLRTDFEESAMVYPITFENGIAGCSIVSSTRLDFFTPVRQRLVQDYTNLMALALSLYHFYKSSQVQLRVLPDPQKQREFFANFSQRLVATIVRLSGQGITRADAEAITLREIEEEILSQSDLFK
ncbi:MAG TPA: hypothetical protein VJO32_10150 [Ktedonobacteraceae bacterium]|nr:hypothetical protein [Ktedonobacteraceae bacterium]